MDIVIKDELQRTLPQNVTKQLAEILIGINTLEDMKQQFLCLRELTELYICVIKHIEMCQKLGEKKANNHYNGCCWSNGVFSDPNFFIGFDGCICSNYDANKSYIETRINDYNMYRSKVRTLSFQQFMNNLYVVDLE